MQDFRETQNEPSLTGGIRRKPVPSRKLTTAPFLDKAETVECFPKGWPISPRVLKVSIYTILWSLLVDFVLLACSVAFFAFACIVKSYDGLPTQDSPHAKERLLSASKYVRVYTCRLLPPSADYIRVLPSSPYSSPLSWAEQRTLS